jgi:regulatory protein
MTKDDPLPPLDPAALATYERALGMLSARARSAKRLAERLRQKGEPPDQVAVVVARLVANGLLDDARFAESRARAGIVGKSRSRRRMAETLAHDGVPREVATAAIQGVLEEEGGEREGALRAGRKKLRALSRLEPAVQRDKLYGFLARQGYPSDVVRATLRALLDAPPPEEASEEGNDPG